jgi:hypothetical protein
LPDAQNSWGKLQDVYLITFSLSFKGKFQKLILIQTGMEEIIDFR